ncbi:MAG: DUF502 domain-containing protein [Planctomycetota bacterium]
MRILAKMFFRGLAAILPLALTGYLVWAAVSAGEAMLRGIIFWFGVRPENYWPGMGFAASIVLVTLVGMLMYSFVVRTVYARVTALLSRIPVVKSVYGMIVDVVQLFGAKDKPFQQVVLVQAEIDGPEIMGFVTRPDFDDLPDIGKGKVAVYVPMSYQLGGFTLIVPRAQIRPIAMKVEEALRFCVTAGVSRQPSDE